jgi:GR25 family glycosyltransferase involved in LPS biosynthesis
MHTFTGAYLIDKKIAKILLGLTDKIVRAADITTAVELYKYKKEGLFFCFYSPLIAKQNYKDFSSNIDHVYDII